MLPQALIEEYWERVFSIVKKKCRLDDRSARMAVAGFRTEIEPKVGEMIYHDNVENVAETVANAVNNGEYVNAKRKGA
jgi:hypothetical protein